MLWVGAGLLALVYAALAAFHVAYGDMNVDEGFYATATRAVWQGEMPYRDFGFTQPPLVAYVNAPMLGLTRFGLFPQRVVNGVWGLLALLLAVRLVCRRGGASAALTLAAIFTCTTGWLYFVHLGKTYALTSLLVMGMATVYVEMKPGWIKSTLLSLLVVLATACRLPAVPFLALLWLAALGEGGRPTWRRVLIAVATLACSAAIILLPFIIAAPEQTWFWTVEFHRISVPKKDWHVSWNDLVGLAPAVWLVVILAVVRRAFARPSWKQPEIAVAGAALVTLAVNLLPGGAYQEYGVPFLLPLAASALILLEPAVARYSAWGRGLTTGVLLVASVALIPAIDWSKLPPEKQTFPSALLPLSTRPYDFALPESIATARTIVRQLLPPGQPFVGPNIILAIEANRPVPRRFRMGAFSCTRDYDEKEADRLHLATFPGFDFQVRDPATPIIGLHPEIKFDYGWSMPSFEFQPPEVFALLQSYIVQDFEIMQSDRNFLLVARRSLLQGPLH